MKVLIMIVGLSSLFLSGCVQNVKSWEKDKLAKESMQKGGSNALLKAYQEHVYYSKEATKGGTGIGGGGCGCN